MDQTIASGHQYLGYATFLLVVGSVVWAWTRSRAGAPYQDGFPRIVGLILAAQVLFGLLTYGAVQGWDYRAAVAYVHPVVMIAAVGLGGVATARARDAEGDAASWMAIARFHGLALLAVLVGIGVASA